MIIFHFLLFIPILVSAVDPFIKGRTLARREDTYDIAQDGVLFGTDYINADHIDDNAESNELDYALFLDGTSNPGDSNLVGSGCSSSQRTSKLRSREQCDNPSAPKPEIPSIDTVGSAAIELKRRCDEGEERLCCAGDAIHFWGGFRAIVPNCAKCASSISFLSSLSCDITSKRESFHDLNSFPCTSVDECVQRLKSEMI